MVCRGGNRLSNPSFIIEIARIERPDDPALLLHRMTAAERAVAMVLLDGLSNQEVADQLAKSVQAVKFLLHRIYQKTGVSSRAALVAALRAGNSHAVAR
jgi:DNA-binding CsgD family transcriptional regulator